MYARKLQLNKGTWAVIIGAEFAGAGISCTTVLGWAHVSLRYGDWRTSCSGKNVELVWMVAAAATVVVHERLPG